MKLMSRASTRAFIFKAAAFFIGLSLLPLSQAQILIEDDGTTLSKGELEFVQRKLPASLRRAAREDSAARYEAIANLLASKKIYKTLQNLTEADGEAFYAFQYALLGAARSYDKTRFQAELELPDFNAVALERYRVSKDVVASVPEMRTSSHILLLCREGCDEEGLLAAINEIKTRLDAGEEFADLAEEASEDPGSKAKGGRLSAAIASDANNIDPAYRDALFALEGVGSISDPVKSQFGYHLIRLEGIEEARIRGFDEVKDALVAEVEKRYREDAYQAHFLQFAPTSDIDVSTEELDTIFGGELAREQNTTGAELAEDGGSNEAAAE